MQKRSALLIVMFVAMLAAFSIGQTPSSTAGDRKIQSRVAPSYPELARRMHIRGVVKIEAIVKPNGAVRSTRVLGGNPVLVDAAIDAIGKWKFEPSQTETTEIVQLTFEGQ
jgi:TonB family protein